MTLQVVISSPVDQMMTMNVPQMHNIVELSDSSVPNLGSCESVLSLNLRAEVAQEDDSGLIRSQEKRSDEKVGRGEGSRVAEGHRSDLYKLRSDVGTH